VRDKKRGKCFTVKADASLWEGGFPVISKTYTFDFQTRSFGSLRGGRFIE
jgi:hypothetical protein